MNKGDTIVCIDNKSNISDYYKKEVLLTIGKSYIVEHVIKYEIIGVFNDENIFKYFSLDRFLTLSEWLQKQRHNKLNELGI
jgi:hypothetical protein